MHSSCVLFEGKSVEKAKDQSLFDACLTMRVPVDKKDLYFKDANE